MPSIRVIRWHHLSLLLNHLALDVVLHFNLLIRLTASEYFLIDLSVLHKLALNQKLRAIQGITEGSLGILAVEHISEFIRELSI